MTEKELEKVISAEIRQAINDCLDVKKSVSKACHDCSERVINVIKEAGWKSPEELKNWCSPKQWKEYQDYLDGLLL